MKPKQLFLRYKFSWLCVLLIIVLSLMPTKEMHLDQVQLSDKWAHFLMYGGLAAVVWTEMMFRNRQRSYALLAGCTLACPTLLGILMELAQAYLTTCRSGDALDALANALGALIVFVFGNLYLVFRKRL